MNNWLRTILAAAKINYGGQAVINGVMMLGKENYAISVTTSKGISTKTFPHIPLYKKNKFFALPFVRGIVNLVDMLIVGYKSLLYSADVAGEEEEGKIMAPWLEAVIMYGSLLFSLVFAVFLFKFLPLSAATFIDNNLTISSPVFNLIDGIIKLGIFVAYIAVIGLYKDVKDLFRYHGGEHKTINCHEANLPLTIKNISAQSQVHLRCGTTFMFVVILISIFVYMIIPKDLPFIYNLGSRLVLLPVVASIAYEMQRLAAKSSSPVLRVLLTPGLWLQSLTVNTPSPRHMRAGRASLQAVLKLEEKK